MNKESTHPLVIKIGGSAFDLGRSCIEPLCNTISELALHRNIVLCVGGGPSLDLLKQLKDEYELTDNQYSKLAPGFIQAQAVITQKLIERTEIIRAGNFDRLTECINNRIIPVVTPSKDGTFQQPLADTDCLAVLVAETLKVPEVLFIKDTPGIYRKCPEMSSTNNPEPIPHVTVDRFKKTVSRIGLDGRDEHLIENSALTGLKNARYLRSIVFLNCRQPQLLHNYLQGEVLGSVLTR